MKRLCYDFHLHSCLSPCGDEEMTPANIAAMASIIGLDTIALTDHNTCRNCPALLGEASKYGISVICGMELCTIEEVHVLCFFPTLEKALLFDSFVYDQALPDIKNLPGFFGRQIIYNENDAPCGELDKMLIGATDIPFSEVDSILKKYDGIMAPAHIDKKSNSLISNLGFIPEGSTFKIAEFKNIANREPFIKRFPYLEGCRFLTSSDAHQLECINEPVNFIEAQENTSLEVYSTLQKWNSGVTL